MPKPKWKPVSDPMSDLELRICDVETAGELLIEAIDTNQHDHVSYLADQINRHAREAKKVYLAAFKEHAELKAALKPKSPEPPALSPNVTALIGKHAAELTAVMQQEKRAAKKAGGLSIVPNSSAD